MILIYRESRLTNKFKSDPYPHPWVGVIDSNYPALFDWKQQSTSAYHQGLHYKISSIESIFDKSDVKALRLIASVRNKKMHEASVNIDIEKFESTCNRIKKHSKKNII